MAKKTHLDEIIEELNTEIEEDAKSLDLKKSFFNQLVTKRNEKKKEVKVDAGNGTPEED